MHEVLFTQSHSGVNADNKLGQMFRESRRNHFVEPVVFVTAKEPKPTRSFFPLPHQTGGINGSLCHCEHPRDSRVR